MRSSMRQLLSLSKLDTMSRLVSIQNQSVDSKILPLDVIFIPISGIKGTNIRDKVEKSVCPWYDGPTLLACLDSLKPLERLDTFPLRIPVIDKYKERGLTWVLGKVETGSITKGNQLCIIPNKVKIFYLRNYT